MSLLEPSQLQLNLASLRERLDALRDMLKLEQKNARLSELAAMTADEALWADQKRAQLLLKEQTLLKNTIETWEKQKQNLDDNQTLLELALEASDQSIFAEIDGQSKLLEQKIQQMEFSTMLSGEHDHGNALISINAGAGGVDAQDWADMLRRMYLRWSERHGYQVEELDYQPGEEAGIKSSTLAIRGEWAYGYLRGESGVHRLVRISPFDSNSRRHTSFSSVFVYPEVDDSIEIEIREEDLEVQTMRSGGAGGQHVNKTESAVRIIHTPSGFVAKCQSERSQHKNKATAIKMLKAMLYNQKLQEQAAQKDKMNGQKKAIEWGNQSRSYVLAPYQQVNDHRTEMKVGNVHAVLDGDLDDLIKEYLRVSL